MKRTRYISRFATVLAACLFAVQGASSQGFGKPLTIQGLDHFTQQSAASRGAGGITVGMQNDISLMFLDPAALQSLRGMQVSAGGPQQYSTAQQDQQYAPLKYYSNFSLLMEGMTGYIGIPDTSKLGGKIPTAGDSVQRPFDNLGPNWGRSKTHNLPLQVFGAVPFSVNDMKFAVGVGTVEYANLNWYFQNNNVLSPSVLSVKQSTTTLPVNNQDSSSYAVQWYQSLQSRKGSIVGYGAALSASLSEQLSIGVSTLILTGSTDDKEVRVDRGRLRFFRDFFRLEPVAGRVIGIGTSDYSGQEFTFSASYHSQYVGIGFSAKPPTTITRKFNNQIMVDTTGVSTTTSSIGEDKLLLPWRGKVGVSLALRENLTFGVEYEIRPYASAEYKSPSGTKTNPWLASNLFHIGAEFAPLPWFVLRAGVREQAEVFEPEGATLEGEPVSYSVYSFGAGARYSGVCLNVAFEYYRMEYSDLWSDAVSINSEIRRSIVANVSYEIPW